MKQLAKLGTVAMKEIKKNKKHEQNKKTLVTGERDKQTCHREQGFFSQIWYYYASISLKTTKAT